MRSLAEENNKPAKRVLKLIEEPSKMLSAVLICNNIVNLSASSISTSYAFSICKRIGMENSTSLFAGIATGILTVLILIFGEITPKSLATQNADKLVFALAPFIRFVCIITKPVVFVLNIITGFIIKLLGGNQEHGPSLTEEELKKKIKNYRQILSIQSMGEEASVGLEKGTASRTFAGISDDVHDIFSNSAGEGNITRILLAVLSFKRLKEQYGSAYKGGLLLIDELDATLYGFSQMKLVEYLLEAAKEFRIQIVFTTHSPIILKCVNKLQRKEFQEKGIELPIYAYNSSVVYLEPQYDREGTRTIMPKNIMSSSELNRILNDINLVAPGGGNKVNIYCEDKKAIDFLRYILSHSQHVNLDLYMDFIDINLGWTNYIQLYEKRVPEFRNNVIVLDGDVPQKREYRNKSRLVEESDNILILPLVIEKDLFVLLKDYECFGEFSQNYSHVSALTYDICFSEWPLDADQYNTNDFKNWFKHIEGVLGNQNILFQYWCDKNTDKVATFIDNFIPKFNALAEQKDADGLPPVIVAESELEEGNEE